MTLTDAVVLLNRLIEQNAIESDFTTLEKLAFVKKEIVNHTCRRSKKQ